MFEVIVGNIGTVYAGSEETAARAAFAEYKSQSQTGYGRAAGEPVTLLRDNQIAQEYVADEVVPS